MAGIVKHIPHPHLHHSNQEASTPTTFGAAAQVLGDDEDDNIPLVERARAEDAKLRKLFRLVDSEVQTLLAGVGCRRARAASWDPILAICCILRPCHRSSSLCRRLRFLGGPHAQSGVMTGRNQRLRLRPP